MTDQASSKRTAFYVSDRTGITAEMVGRSILTQFEKVTFEEVALPFIDSVEKANQAALRISEAYKTDGARPVIFSTLVHPEIRDIFARTGALYLDCIQSFIGPLESELGMHSTSVIGGTRSSGGSLEYLQRIEAINFTLAHDDGVGVRDINEAEIILVGVSRCGKTPTSLYISMQFGLRAANCPLIPEDLEAQRLPSVIEPQRHKLFGLTIEPERLHHIRTARRPGSPYATLANCADEVRRAELLMRREGIRFIDASTKSIEELASAIIYQAGLKRHVH